LLVLESQPHLSFFSFPFNCILKPDLYLLKDKFFKKARVFKYIRSENKEGIVPFCWFLLQKAMRATRILFVLLWFFCVYSPAAFCANVTYDHRALVIDGKRRVLVSGSIHYPRSTPEVLLITLFMCLFKVTRSPFFVCVLEVWT